MSETLHLSVGEVVSTGQRHLTLAHLHVLVRAALPTHIFTLPLHALWFAAAHPVGPPYSDHAGCARTLVLRQAGGEPRGGLHGLHACQAQCALPSVIRR